MATKKKSEFGKMARPLSPDLNPWDQQPGEAPDVYKAFVEFRDSEDRKVRRPGDDGATGSRRARQSATWSWAYRAKAWDRHVATQELDELVRYRIDMNRRHRRVARVAQGQFVTWLQRLTPEDVARWKPMEAVRVYETAVRIEREAAGAHLAAEGQLPEQNPEPLMDGPASLGEMFNVDPATEAEIARVLAEAMRPK